MEHLFFLLNECEVAAANLPTEAKAKAEIGTSPATSEKTIRTNDKKESSESGEPGEPGDVSAASA